NRSRIHLILAMTRRTGTPVSLFATTRWSLIGDVVRGEDTLSRAGFAELFKIYWSPLYRYVRRKGYSAPDAEDLVQGFFAHLLEGNGLRLVVREKGRFRAFLLGSLKHYML